MHAKQLYEYAIIRVVPRVEREEFVNVGIILFCKKSGYLQCSINLDRGKINCLYAEVDMDAVELNLNSFVAIAQGDKNAGPIAKLPVHERFRWLTAARSTIIQTGKVHPGFANCAEEEIEKLSLKLVL